MNSLSFTDKDLKRILQQTDKEIEQMKFPLDKFIRAKSNKEEDEIFEKYSEKITTTRVHLSPSKEGSPLPMIPDETDDEMPVPSNSPIPGNAVTSWEKSKEVQITPQLINFNESDIGVEMAKSFSKRESTHRISNPFRDMDKSPDSFVRVSKIVVPADSSNLDMVIKQISVDQPNPQTEANVHYSMR